MGSMQVLSKGWAGVLVVAIWIVAIIVAGVLRPGRTNIERLGSLLAPLQRP
jgi:hypothetical protein